MIDPTRDTTPETLRRLQDASFERFHRSLMDAIEQMLIDFEMTWEDLTKKANLRRGGEGVLSLKEYVGKSPLTMEELNAIAAAFSAEPYILFRPRFPWTQK